MQYLHSLWASSVPLCSIESDLKEKKIKLLVLVKTAGLQSSSRSGEGNFANCQICSKGFAPVLPGEPLLHGSRKAAWGDDNAGLSPQQGNSLLSWEISHGERKGQKCFRSTKRDYNVQSLHLTLSGSSIYTRCLLFVNSWHSQRFPFSTAPVKAHKKFRGISNPGDTRARCLSDTNQALRSKVSSAAPSWHTNPSLQLTQRKVSQAIKRFKAQLRPQMSRVKV